VEFCWIDPCLRKEIEMLWKLLLKAFEMHPERTLPANIIHPQEVVHSLFV